VRSFHAILLATFLLPRLGVAQGNSEPTPSPSDELAWGPGHILKAPGHAVGATARGLGKLIKHVPTTAAPDQPEATGFTGFVQIQGRQTPLGKVFSGDVSVGYDFTPHMGADVGLPFFFVRSPFSLVTNHDWRTFTLWGEPYVDVHYKRTSSKASFLSVLTGTIPASNTRKIFTTGRFGVDWFNHLERDFKVIGPFLNLGAANQTVNRYFMPRPYNLARPYQSLGFVSDFEGGLNFTIHRGFKIGGSAYALQPAGQQKVFSRLVAPDSSVVGDYAHNRYFYHAFEAISGRYLDEDSSKPRLGPGIARDNGYSGWLEITRMRNVTLQVGYTRSVHYAFDSLTIMLNINVTSLMRGPTQ
jgi:hypothetical protein